MCATTLAPEPQVATDLMLESTLATAHDKWMAEVHQILLPVTFPEATFWEKWDAVRYLAERLPDQLQLERELSGELRPFISSDAADRLLLLADRVTRLHRECDRLGHEPCRAREFASRTKELLEAVRLWCAEFELAAGQLPESAVTENVMRLLGRMSWCSSSGWVGASLP